VIEKHTRQHGEPFAQAISFFNKATYVGNPDASMDILNCLVSLFSDYTKKFEMKRNTVYLEPFHGLLKAIRYQIDSSLPSLKRNHYSEILFMLHENLKSVATALEEFTSHAAPEGLEIEGETSDEQYLSSHAFHTIKECIILIVSLARVFFVTNVLFLPFPH
jgi:hypothetical protein